MSELSTSIPPKFSWRVNGGSYYPNNKFTICFYDVNDTLKASISDILIDVSTNSNGTIATYNTMTPQTWNTILSQFPSPNPYIGIAVKGYLDETTDIGSPVSGPYVSMYRGLDMTSYGVTVNNSYANPTGAGSYIYGNTVTIKAGTRTGYVFSGWTVNSGGISLPNSATATFTMPSKAVTVTANWTQAYSVSVDCSYASTTGSGLYTSGSTVTINAHRPGFFFDGWVVTSGNVSLANSSNATTTFTMPSGHVTVEATWIEDENDGWIAYGSEQLYPYFEGCEWCVPYELQYFGLWYWDVYYGYAYFETYGEAESFTYEEWYGLQYLDDWTDQITSVQYGLYYSVPSNDIIYCGNGPYTVSVNGSYAGTTGADDYYPADPVTIYAGSRSGYQFNGWTVDYGDVDLDDSGSATTYFIMPKGAVSVTANWVSATTYSVTVNGSNANPTGADDYTSGSTVTIYAGTKSGYVFSGWTVNSGGVSLAGPNNAINTFTMPNNNVSVTANWTIVGSWEEYGASLIYPDDGGYEYRVPYVLYLDYVGSGIEYYGYAYFDNQSDAEWFRLEAYYYIQYLDTWTDPSTNIQHDIYYQVFWEIWHYENGDWVQIAKK